MTNRQKLFDYFAQEHGITLLDSDYNELDNYAASVEAEKWKPYPENKPEEIKNYIIQLTDKGYDGSVFQATWNGDTFEEGDEFVINWDKEVIAFRELPTPYQPEGREPK